MDGWEGFSSSDIKEIKNKTQDQRLNVKPSKYFL